jgi:uncharacterized protein (TIGR02466 family)
MSNHVIHEIFPTPVYVGELGRSFTEDEMAFLNFGAEMYTKNYGNNVSYDKQVLEEDAVQGLKSDILKHVETYIKQIMDPKFPITPYITQSWLNVTLKNQSHHKHYHLNSLISGVIYIQAENDSINFYTQPSHMLSINPNTYNKFNSLHSTVSVSTGNIVLFPSQIEHSVPTKTDDNKRISLAFNVFVKGMVGEYEQSTELILK